ncbi:MAG: hypothetical protein O8C66_02175 [Candidatus Methanoperedens sp.]|nr:hypothetical protein [Candidatus Methanoperedens sp.]MCZ7369293.1 hypothetical protein [Candidatus Methanoperedens sp.]
MESFSQRKGIKPVKNIIQVDSMDNELRNGLWNALTVSYWNQISSDYKWRSYHKEIWTLINRLWHDYFKTPIDTINPDWWELNYKILRKYFFKCEWYEVYDFTEFIANNYPDETNLVNPKFIDYCNHVLEKELSGCRFVGGKITQITKEEEIAEIEEALEIPDSLKAIKIHLKTSLDLLADRKSPDYRNSVKESISAVEAICKLISNNKTATLTTAIEAIERGKKMKMHPALARAFKELYFYTNAAEGIRHGLSDEPNLDFEDAKFMLVSCSAFVNYLVVKASKAGVEL